jgi:hypothetical protein
VGTTIILGLMLGAHFIAFINSQFYLVPYIFLSQNTQRIRYSVVATHISTIIVVCID